MISIEINERSDLPKILVAGIGGGGNNSVGRMLGNKVKGVSYAAINTDAQVLNRSNAGTVLKIGQKLTGGYGAGADPAVGEAAALESEEDIKKLVSEYNLVILTCGMGGGTGTGAIPVMAGYCHDMGILTVAVVTLPFSFESEQRMTVAKAGIEKLKDNVDMLLVIPNDKLLKMGEKVLYLEDAFGIADSVLKYTIEGMTNIIYNEGNINIDFNDLKTIITNKGLGHLGIGTVDGKGSILDAVKQAMNSPLLETSITGAENILINTSGKINLMELDEAMESVRSVISSKAKIIWGTVRASEAEEEKIVVTLIATGLKENAAETGEYRSPLPMRERPAVRNTAHADRGVNYGLNCFVSGGNVSRTGCNAKVTVPAKDFAVQGKDLSSVKKQEAVYSGTFQNKNEPAECSPVAEFRRRDEKEIKIPSFLIKRMK